MGTGMQEAGAFEDSRLMAQSTLSSPLHLDSAPQEAPTAAAQSPSTDIARAPKPTIGSGGTFVPRPVLTGLDAPIGDDFDPTRDPDFRMLPIKPSSQKTYDSRTTVLWNYSEGKRRTSEDPMEPVPVTLTDVVEDFFARDDLAPTTSANYRVALIRWVQSSVSSRSTLRYVQTCRDVLQRLREQRIPLGRPSRREKNRIITEPDYRALVANLQRKAVAGSDWAQRTLQWFEAGAITGLRPGEWLTARWNDPACSELFVETSKGKLAVPGNVRHLYEEDFLASQARGENLTTEPKTRLIPVPREFDQFTVEQHMRQVAKWLATWRGPAANRPMGRPSRAYRALEEDLPVRELTPEQRLQAFEAYYESVRFTLRRACLDIWGGKKCYSLYSARQLFSANSRAEYGKAASEALMGHSEYSNNGRFYSTVHQAHSFYKGLAAKRIEAEGQQIDPAVRHFLKDGAARLTSPGQGLAPEAGGGFPPRLDMLG